MGLQLGKKPLCWETLNAEHLAFVFTLKCFSKRVNIILRECEHSNMTLLLDIFLETQGKSLQGL